MDEIQAAGSTVSNVKKSFGGIEMTLRATVNVGLFQQLIGSKKYEPNQINRTTNFVYKAGTSVFELTSPKEEVYVMQSYSQIVNPALDINDLSDLARQLKLPSGWKYQSREIKEDLSLIADGIAYVIQDNLMNTYQRLNP